MFLESMNDQELMDRIGAKDEAAFDFLLEKYEEGLRKHIEGIVRQADTAGDTLQAVLLRIWTCAEQWDGRGSLKSWMFRIATNCALNELRRQRRTRETPLIRPVDEMQEEDSSTPAWMLEAAAVAPDEALQIAEQARLVQSLIRTLPDDKREVLRLVVDEQMDVSEVASLLGVPRGTVRSRLHYARRRLAEQWDQIKSEWEDI